MPAHPGASGARVNRRVRQLRPHLVELEPRVVLSLTFPGIAGITLDSSGDVFVSYNSTTERSGQQQSVAEVAADGRLASASVFDTTGASAFPGVLTPVGASAALPNIDDSTDILELQPNGQLFVFDPVSGTSAQFDNLASYAPSASKVYDVQTGSFANLGSEIDLANATYGDFGVYGSSLVVSAESNNWDFVMRVTYASQGSGTATVLVASPASDNQPAAPGGVAVGPQGTVLATLPYLPTGATAAIHVPVGFNLFYGQGNSPQPFIPTLGLTSLPDIDSGGIAVDSQNNFILAVSNSSLYGGGPGIAHINSALTAFLADPTTPTEAIPFGITAQTVDGTNYLAYTDPAEETYNVAGELPLFSGQVSPSQLRQAYGVNQISFTGPDGTKVAGTGAGQTIAIVEEGVDPTLEADLHTFDQFFGIPDPPSFQIVDQNGVTTQNDEIVGEASLDVEWAHAIAPDASIVVYNAAFVGNNTTSYLNLLSAMHEASLLPGVSVVTLSYGEAESDLAASGVNESQYDSDFTTAGVTFLAASGDTGIYADDGTEISVNYPSASPNVVSVGGTSIVIDSAGDYPGTGPTGEIAWGEETENGFEGGGGGSSTVEPEPAWQTGVVPASIDDTGARALPDVSMDSGAAQEYDVFTSTLSGSSDSPSAVGWLGDAGTSAASPIWAGLIAIADQGRALEGGTPLTGYNQTLPALYSLPAADFHDILYGNNGDLAGPGYDLASGLGTPVANLLVPDLASYELPSQNANSTQIVVTASPTTPVVGHAVTLNAKVGVVSPGIGVPTGIVTFEDGSTILGTSPSQQRRCQPDHDTDSRRDRNDHDRLWRRYQRPAQQCHVPDQRRTAAHADAQPRSTPTPSPTPSPTPTPSPLPVVIVGEKAVFKRKTNKKGKPVGKPVLTGFAFHFNDALDASSAGNPVNYQIDRESIKKVKRKNERVLHPLTSFTVSYDPTSSEATILFTAKETFPSGGQITILSGVTGGSGASLGGLTVFKISKGGSRIEPE